MSLDSIVNVQITRETSVPTRQGFGEGAFVSEDAVFQPLIKVYGSVTEVTDDALAGAETLKAATLYFGQEVRPTKFYAIKKGRDLAHVQVITFSGEFVADNSISIDVDGQTVTQLFDTDSDTTLAGLATKIAAEAGVATAVEDTAANTITVTGAVVNDLVVLENLSVTGGASQPTGSIATTQYPDEVKTYVESIARAQQINNDWYGIAIQSKTKADQEAVAAVILAQVKLFFFSTAAAEAKTAGDTTDIGSVLKATSNDRAVPLYSAASATNHPEMAFMGGQLPKLPGAITWAFKELKGVAVDELTENEKTVLHGKNYNTYTEVGGLNITENGTTCEGEFIDIIRGTDFIQVRMKEGVFQLLANADKVPFTDKGIAQVENEMRAVLRQATNQGILTADPEYMVEVPLAADVSTADKGNRLLPDMKFFGTYAGAIHKTEIRGVLSL